MSLALVSSAVAAPKVVKPPKCKAFRLSIESVPARGSRILNLSFFAVAARKSFSSLMLISFWLPIQNFPARGLVKTLPFIKILRSRDAPSHFLVD